MLRFSCWITLLLGLMVLLGGVAFASPLDIMVTIRGEIERQGEGSCLGMVLLWPTDGAVAEAPEHSNLVPLWVEEIDAECQFEIKAPPGSYSLQVVVRQGSSEALGPLLAGDLLFTTEAAGGNALQVSGNAGDQLHLGTFTISTEFAGYPEDVETGITGRVVDDKGAPVAGIRVLAFTNPEMFSGLYAVAPLSDDEGWFRLHLVSNAEVYLQAQEEIGPGLPLEGRLFGVYGGKEARLIKVKQGNRVEQVDIVVAPRIEENAAGKK